MHTTCSSLDARFRFSFSCDMSSFSFLFGVTAFIADLLLAVWCSIFCRSTLLGDWPFLLGICFFASFGDLVLYKLRLIDAIAHALLNDNPPSICLNASDDVIFMQIIRHEILPRYDADNLTSRADDTHVPAAELAKHLICSTNASSWIDRYW